METSSQHAVSALGLSIGYRSGKGHVKTVHPHICFTLERGELTSLIGLNGAGKSTLIRTLCRFLPPLGGSVVVNGKDISDYTAHEFALTVGVVLTDKTNAGGLTVRELVSLGRQPYTGFFGKLDERDRKVAEEAMKSVGIYHKADNYVSELSDGERQRAMIAKALAQECPVIILDEPTAFLDVASRIETMALLHDTARLHGKAILLSTHDIDNALMFSDRLLLLSPDTDVVSGTPEDLVLDGSLGKFFAGRGMNFDVRSGRLSTSVSGENIGVSGDSLTARWMANALARNGYTPVLPSEGIPYADCVSPCCINVYSSDGVLLAPAASISEALSLICRIVHGDGNQSSSSGLK